MDTSLVALPPDSHFIIFFVGSPGPASIIGKLVSLTLKIIFIMSFRVSIAIINLDAQAISNDVQFPVLGSRNMITKGYSNFLFSFLKRSAEHFKDFRNKVSQTLSYY